MDIFKSLRWQGKIVWHNVFGHPRPWHVLDQATYCAGCGEEIRSF